MRLKLSLLILSVFCMGQASAGLLIDPYVGAGRAASAITTPSGYPLSVSDPDATSTSSIGSRLGYSFLLFSAGIDYEMLKADKDNITNTSLFVGVDLPILFRFWAEYMLSSKLDADSGIDFDFQNGYSIGAGFTGLPFVSINLELATLNYQYGVSYSGTDYDFDYKIGVTTLSVSLPLDF